MPNLLSVSRLACAHSVGFSRDDSTNLFITVVDSGLKALLIDAFVYVRISLSYTERQSVKGPVSPVDLRVYVLYYCAPAPNRRGH